VIQISVVAQPVHTAAGGRTDTLSDGKETEMLKSPGHADWSQDRNFGISLSLGLKNKHSASVSTPEFWSQLLSGGQNFGLGRLGTKMDMGWVHPWVGLGWVG